MIDRRSVTGVVVAAGCILVGSGCGQPSGSDLHKAARSLIPPGATVVIEKDGGCVEGARFPSCVLVYFRLEHHRVGERLNLFIANAQRHGWKAEQGGSAGGEVIVKLSKGSYRGGGGFWLDRYYRPTRHCNPVTTLHACADHFQIQWKGGIIKA